ncbi:SAM-dependent methyltransferase [Mycobacterium sp. MS1601]|uniref:class I SAM-dependent methyltransferase n=1 Tax=Mycobacterium sp. MS1601 TaxID=1936029 RepID=UPI0009791D60|nr:class I SAM-dependent methyltransferase [Mycobacterium sp. MS1601]AQA06508.1 SAM-dependent methyltransferase [Mycobacterium sp. MS1601]
MANQHQSSSPQREAMSRRLMRRSAVSGQIQLPAVPSMVDDYVALCGNVFSDVGRAFNEVELDNLRQLLQRQLDEAFKQSPRSSITISYSAGVAALLNYEINIEWWSLEKTYENWIATRKPPLFGTEPDARVWTLAAAAPDPAAFPVLDVGAGTGRNTMALARRGHPVDAVELTGKFAEQIADDAERESLPVRVVIGDIFASSQGLRDDYMMILLSEVVSDFRTTDQLRALFELASAHLAPGGQLVFNVFVTKPGYELDDATRELGQQCYAAIFSPDEIAAAAAGLRLILLSDESVYDYEKKNLPPDKWPPTSWYAEWVSGQDVFDMPREETPVEMRWHVYGKIGTPGS